jgi:tRNA-specific 2-thiouridylase
VISRLQREITIEMKPPHATGGRGKDPKSELRTPKSIYAGEVKIAVLCSGGVDSSVALLRLAAEGRHELTACYLKIWLEDELAFLGTCPWEDDLEALRGVCGLLGVPLEIVPLQREYLETVVAYALAELRAGRTPSPDVMCNRMIKFGAFVARLGGDYELVASGHHARVGRRAGLARLLIAADRRKDQTYFLSQLSQAQLARCMFPIGDLTKPEVREAARRAGLPNAERPDSQGLCFLGRVPFADFVRCHLGERRGEIRDLASGAVLGEHRGTWLYTIGQRHGLGLAGGPWFVVDKDLERNRVLVVHAERLRERSRSRFLVPNPHWIAEAPSRAELEVKLRHGERSELCSVAPAEAGGLVVALLAGADPGLAPGQFAVFYDGGECLGGGIIAWP